MPAVGSPVRIPSLLKASGVPSRPLSIPPMSAKNEVHDEINSHKEDQKYVHEEELYQPEVDTSGIDEKKLMRKVDWNVIPWLALLYLLNSLDRGNIGNAKVRQWPCLMFI